MKKILIFKTDRLGDLLNISAIISNLRSNNPSCDITLVCSKYNKSLAEYYTDELSYIIYDNSLILFIIKNFNSIILKKYDLILQLDGKNHSYLLSALIRSTNKACIKFIKNKKFLGFNFEINRPNFFINSFFNLTVSSFENYNLSDNKKFHYLGLYLSLIDKLNIKIETKNHYLKLKEPYKIPYAHDNYLLIHLDKRWEKFSFSVRENLKKKILSLSLNKKIYISSNIGGNQIFDFIKKELSNSVNVEFFYQPSLHQIISLVYYSESCLSSHSGLIVHSAAAFKKNIIDLVPPEINNELDRWVPFNVNYKRFDINDFKDKEF